MSPDELALVRDARRKSEASASSLVAGQPAEYWALPFHLRGLFHARPETRVRDVSKVGVIDGRSSPQRARDVPEYLVTERRASQGATARPGRFCQACGRPLPAASTVRRRYCGPLCRVQSRRRDTRTAFASTS